MKTNIKVEDAANLIGMRLDKLKRLLALDDTDPRKPRLLYYSDEEAELLDRATVEEYKKHSEERQGRAHTLTKKQIDEIIKTISRQRHSKRNRALIAISNFAGLRVSEISKLLISDVANKDLSIRQMAIMTRAQTKTKVARTVYLTNGKLIMYLTEHIEQRIKYGAQFNDPLFVGVLTGKAYTRHRLAQLFKQIYSYCGYPELSSHSGRRTAGTRIMKKTNDAKLAQKILGHSSVNTTLLYIEKTDEDAKKAVSKL